MKLDKIEKLLYMRGMEYSLSEAIALTRAYLLLVKCSKEARKGKVEAYADRWFGIADNWDVHLFHEDDVNPLVNLQGYLYPVVNGEPDYENWYCVRLLDGAEWEVFDQDTIL